MSQLFGESLSLLIDFLPMLASSLSLETTVLISVLTLVAGGGITYGAMRSDIHSLKQRISSVEKELRKNTLSLVAIKTRLENMHGPFDRDIDSDPPDPED